MTPHTIAVVTNGVRRKRVYGVGFADHHVMFAIVHCKYRAGIGDKWNMNANRPFRRLVIDVPRVNCSRFQRPDTTACNASARIKPLYESVSR